MVSFIINELTGVTPVEIGDALFWESDRIPVDNQHLPPTMPLEVVKFNRKDFSNIN